LGRVDCEAVLDDDPGDFVAPAASPVGVDSDVVGAPLF
jgi:hypothetical protein